MNTARKGNEGENLVSNDQQRRGWTYGSRRHIGGPGDGLSVKAGYRPRLIEVKKTQTAWSNFGPEDRRALIDYCAKHDLDALLAHVVGGRVDYIPPEAWPKERERCSSESS